MIYNQRSDAVLLRRPMGLLVATLHIDSYRSIRLCKYRESIICSEQIVRDRAQIWLLP